MKDDRRDFFKKVGTLVAGMGIAKSVPAKTIDDVMKESHDWDDGYSSLDTDLTSDVLSCCQPGCDELNCKKHPW